MITLHIPEHKEFMAKLLISDMFHSYLVQEVSITTYNTFMIDGRIQKDFYDDEWDGPPYSKWEELKPYCFSIIKGKKTPLHFKLIFCLPAEKIKHFLAKEGLAYRLSDIHGLYLNIRYDGLALYCTSGTSLQLFTTDKTLDYAWDDYILQFFKRNCLPYEIK